MNHINNCELSAAPKPNEILQIVDYVKRLFDCKVEFKNRYMTICGLKNKMVYNWAKEKLDDYIRDDFPMYWQDSLK